jgi:translation initiation factor 2 gamma subunit (eIF-2gamma)
LRRFSKQERPGALAMLRGNLAGKVTKGDRFMGPITGFFDTPPNLKETVPEKAEFPQ